MGTAPHPTPYLQHSCGIIPLVRSVCCAWSMEIEQTRVPGTAPQGRFLHHKQEQNSTRGTLRNDSPSPTPVHENWHFITSGLCMPPLPLYFRKRAGICLLNSVCLSLRGFQSSCSLISFCWPKQIMFSSGLLSGLLPVWFSSGSIISPCVCEPSKWICLPITRSIFSK